MDDEKLNIFADDDSHPIPYLEALDVCGVKKGGGGIWYW